jgi:maltose/maltodextrin transport system substrate-binding protein/arabinogalactan oligomer/maltooligosaccharide transport system substrate-binding protein
MNRRSLLLMVLAAAMVMLAIAPAVMAQDELVIWADAGRAPILVSLGEAFEEEFGVGVDVQEVDFGGIRDNLKTAGPAGEGPDIIIGAHDWLGELLVNGLLEPIDLGDEAENFAPAALAAFSADGVLYGLPYVTENVAFVWNPELVETPPATWDEVFALSQEIVDSGAAQYGFIRQSGDPYHFFPIQTAFGGYVFGFNEDGSYNAEDLGIDSEGSLAAAEWYQSLVEAGLQPTDVDYDVMHGLFTSGDAAMIITGPWAMAAIRESGIPYEVGPIPAGPDGTTAKPFLGVHAFMLSAFSENKLLAEAFLLDFVLSDTPVTITTEDGAELTGTTMELLQAVGTRASAYLPALENATDPDFAGFSEAGAEALAMPSIPEMGSVWSAWDGAVVLITNGQSDADTAFTDAATQIRTLIEEGGE